MKKGLFILGALLSSYSAFGATGESCKNFLVSELTHTLQSAKINLTSKTLQNDVTDLLLPKMKDIIENTTECKGVRQDLLLYDQTDFSVSVPNHTFDIQFNFSDSLANTAGRVTLPEDMMESVLPWYGILVVKKGSLDTYANQEAPIISTEYMKQHKSQFYPDNSNKMLGIARACTHGNHTANDKDVINRATHITMDEADSFWKGNDYYVYDGEDVYWGWAQAVGEVALAIVTLGISAEATAANAAVQGANVAVQGASKAVAASKITKNSAKIAKAAEVAKKAKAGSSAAATASRAEATKALAEAGITVKKGTRATELVKIGTALETASKGITDVKWVSSLARPWKMVKPGMTTLNPKNTAKVYGKGVTWGQRIKRGAIQAATPVIGVELIKAFGYSSASYKLDDNLKFNSFGLLSADDLEGRENEVSHGAWIKFEEAGAINEDDTLKEALRFAEEFQEDVSDINKQDPLCDVDIYVVQPAISNPKTMGKREVYYIIQNPGGSLRVEK